MKVLFRTDASRQIGTGHVMRCLTLAKALRNRGAHCRFVSRAHEGNMIERIKQEGFDAISLPFAAAANPVPVSDAPVVDHAHWLGADAKSDAEKTLKVLADFSPDWLVLDHYALDARWERDVKSHCGKIMVIDDLADRAHDCDLLLDQNLVANLVHRYDDRVPERCARLLGPAFALLQMQYAELRPHVQVRSGPVKRILIFFGGSDLYDLTGRTLRAFLTLQRPEIAVDVVGNAGSSNWAAIEQLARMHANIHLHHGLPSLAPLMLAADLAIGGGGTTTWERLCLGLPSLVVTVAANQKDITAELNRQGYVRWIGDQDSATESLIISALKDVLEKSGQDIAEWSRKCMDLVDGNGCERVASVLSLNSSTELLARDAQAEDEELLLRWANDPTVRLNAFHSAQIDPQGHHQWFSKRLQNPEQCRIYIVQTEEGFPIGQVRFDLSENGWSIDYSLDCAVRGRKLGAKLLSAAIDALKSSAGEVRIFGQVKAMNHSSQKVFQNLGFTQVDNANEIVTYQNFA